MSGYIPNEIIEAPKQGFSSPDASWFKGDSIEFVKSSLLVKDTPINNYLSFETIEKLIGEHLSGKKSTLINLVSLEY